MRAILVSDDARLTWSEAPDPEPGPGEALIEVHATAVNRADLSQRAGHYPPPPGASEVLGLECAGVLSFVPDGDHGFRAGDEACALLAGGGYAELVSVPVGMLMRVPLGWTMAQAAAMPEVFYTAYLNLVVEAGLERGERVLVHGGASGVGTAAIQLARHFGCPVAVTVGTAEKAQRCRELGAELAINYREADFAEEVAHVFPGGVDVVLDMVGADTFARDLEILRLGGRIVVIATLSGARASIDLRQLMAKRATVKGSTLRNRPLAEKVALKGAIVEACWGAFEDGRLTPVIDSVLPIAEAEAAHARMRANENIGKIVLALRDGADGRREGAG